MKYTEVCYKYKVHEDISCESDIRLDKDVVNQYFVISKDGEITAMEGYMWDGASGPTYDTDNTLVPSLFHDILYQAMRDELIPRSNRLKADKLFYKQLRERGMMLLRAKYYFHAVRRFAKKYTYPQKEKIYEVK